MGEALPLAGAESAELYECPVRKRYLWQLVRYRGPLARWIRALHASADGRDVAIEERIAAMLKLAQEGTRWYPESFARAGVQWSDFEKRGDLAAFPRIDRETLQARF